MKLLLTKLLLAFSTILLSVGCTTQVTQRDRIVIVEQSGMFGFTVPASELVMMIPKSGLQRQVINEGVGTNNPRYFNFYDPKTRFILSGWFEPASRFTSTKSIFNEWNATKKADPSLEPRDVEFKKIGRWDCVVFVNSLGSVQRKQIHAHLIQDGTWIHLHISVNLNAESSAQEFLDAIIVNKFRSK